jgi:twitching motility protein PilT
MSTHTNQRIDRFLQLMKDRGASDLHLSVGRPPILRRSGRIEPVRYRILSDIDFTNLMQPITPPALWERYRQTGDIDYAYEIPGLARFRVNMFVQERGMGAVFRIIPTKILTLDQLQMPPSVHAFAKLTSGLVLVTGPTGSGKSTTLSAIVNEMNEKRNMHIITIEDPLEFVHPNKTALVSQREVGTHSKNFGNALKAAVREDPDCILVGEMRDLETISMALAAAETGLLVFGTLHTNSAAKTMDRVINVFPADRQDGVRAVISTVIKGVLAQQLLRRKKGGRVAAIEVLFQTPALSSLIREGKTHHIAGVISQGKSKGMIAMDDSLRKLVEEDVIEPSAALEKAIAKDDMKKWLAERGIEVEDPSE